MESIQMESHGKKQKGETKKNVKNAMDVNISERGLTKEDALDRLSWRSGVGTRMLSF